MTPVLIFSVIQLTLCVRGSHDSKGVESRECINIHTQCILSGWIFHLMSTGYFRVISKEGSPDCFHKR